MPGAPLPEETVGSWQQGAREKENNKHGLKSNKDTPQSAALKMIDAGAIG